MREDEVSNFVKKANKQETHVALCSDIYRLIFVTLDVMIDTTNTL